LECKVWVRKFIDYKNSFQRDVLEVKETQKGFDVKTKSGDIQYVVFDDLSKKEPNFTSERVVCLNNIKNVNWLGLNWDVLAKTNAVFLFVNPDKNEHWTIRPRHHNLIAERKDIKRGLLTLMESINLYE
jgi:hypothetical protein